MTEELQEALKRIPRHLLVGVRARLPDPNNDPRRWSRYIEVVVYPQKIQSLRELCEESPIPARMPTARLEFEIRHYGNYWSHVKVWDLKEITFSSTWPKEPVE